MFIRVDTTFKKLIHSIRDGNCLVAKDKCCTVIKLKIADKNAFYGIYQPPVGRGGFGEVYKAYLINEDSGEFDLNKNYVAIKVIPQDFNYLEVQTLQYIYGAAYFHRDQFSGVACIKSNDVHYIITPFYPGSPLTKEFENTDIDNLNFIERITLISQILLQLNNLHSEKPTHPTIVHGDTKHGNIMAAVTNNQNRTQVEGNIIDFGLCQFSSKVINPSEVEGEINYLAPETRQTHTKDPSQDIFSLTAIIISILGGQDVFRFKKLARGFINKLNSPYYSADILEDKNIELPYPPLRSIIIDLLDRMQAMDPTHRPDTNELLRFFISLLNCSLYYKKATDAEHKEEMIVRAEVETCKLILIARNLWQTQTFEKFDFEANEVLAQALVYIDEFIPLTLQIITDLMAAKEHSTVNKIVDLYKKGILNKDVINELLEKRSELSSAQSAVFFKHLTTTNIPDEKPSSLYSLESKLS